jgi:hypothetical protein
MYFNLNRMAAMVRVSWTAASGGPAASPPPSLAKSASNDDFRRSIEAAILEISTMWLLHYELGTARDHSESLEQQIIRFSAAALDANQRSHPELQTAGRERLWLIYFKGLMTAHTHAPDVMLAAVRNVAFKWGFGEVLQPLSEPEEVGKRIPHRLSDAEALEQIARGLERNIA